MNTISLEQGRAIAERLLEEALARLDISSIVRSDSAYGICEVIGLTLRC
jgi:hypothetical protein